LLTVGSERRGAPAERADALDARLVRRSRIATGFLATVVIGLGSFAVWSSQATNAASDQAVSASDLSDDYSAAASAVAAEESLERKYRLEPGPEVRDRYDSAAHTLVAALGDVRRDGDATDVALVNGVLSLHFDYLSAIDAMFTAVDENNTAVVLDIDGTQVDPKFAAIESAVTDAADVKHDLALARLARLQDLEALTRKLTPLLFLAGLLLAAVVGSVTRRHRRLLLIERRRALRDSLHDALTGLPNRTALAERFGASLHAATRAGTRTALLLIDLDRFKEINDTFGHPLGDDLLTQIGPRLTGALRDVDTVARLGGDEFAVLVPGVRDEAAATAVAVTLREALSEPFRVDGVDLDIEASIGVVVSGEHGLDADVLLQRADIAMYVAKTRDIGVFAYDPDTDGNTPAKVALLGELRRAIERRELVLYFQPKISISTGDLVGAEALVRWQHPERGLVPPDAFIPLAEHTGLIGPLTRYVLDAALAQARVWADAGRPLTVSVNLSARNLLDDGLLEHVATLLKRHGLGADALELEVTESAIMTEPVRAKQLLERLASMGLRIAIDDFGVGYTSLGQLKDLPITELKIDRSFVMTMLEDHSNAVIVHSVVDLGHNLGLTIVAEGVESEQALDVLAGYGCDVAQGYHLSRPMPAEAFDAWAADRPAAATGTAVHPGSRAS
jgi:diguanylate cyclase (GGDEF)-like protein